MKILVIGYGNPVRGDDAVGLWVVERLSGHGGIEAVVAWPFKPELIFKIAEADLVVFVDADARSGPVRWRKLKPSPKPAALSHVPPPEELLAWAKVVGKAPEAWLVTIPGSDFSLGHGISPRTREAAEEVIHRLEEWYGTFSQKWKSGRREDIFWTSLQNSDGRDVGQHREPGMEL